MATNFVGGANAALSLATPGVAGSTVTLTWSAVEGGTYKVEATSDFSNWSTLSTNSTPVGNSGAYTNTGAPSQRFYRVARTALAAYDTGSNNTGGGGNTIITMNPASGNRGQTYSVTATISSTATPPLPPSGAPVQKLHSVAATPLQILSIPPSTVTGL